MDRGRERFSLSVEFGPCFAMPDLEWRAIDDMFYRNGNESIFRRQAHHFFIELTLLCFKHHAYPIHRAFSK